MAIALLGLLVVGLLRSHAEILRRLHELGLGLEADARHSPSSTVEVEAGAGVPAHDVVGETPAGEAAAVGVTHTSHHTLVAFLSSGCLTCAGFWRAFASPDGLALPSQVRPLIVTKSSDAESLSEIEKLAPAAVSVIMSTKAWVDYQVPGSPYFVLVDGPGGTVAAEATGDNWEEVRTQLLGPDTRSRRGNRPARRPGGDHDPDRPELVDAELLAGGIGPGHPSLYPEDRA